MKKGILTALVVSVLMAVFCFSAFAGSGATEEDPVTTEAELKAAIAAVTDATPTTIYVSGTITLESKIAIANAGTLGYKVNITLKGVGEGGATVQATTAAQINQMFEVASGGHVITIENITFDARVITYNAEAGTWTQEKIDDGSLNRSSRTFTIYGNTSVGQSVLNLKAGAVIKGGYRGDGGGLYNDGGIINMYDGAVITECKGDRGGGCYQTSTSIGVFNMYGGEIYNNVVTATSSSNYGGPAIHIYGGTLNITGGKIYNNVGSRRSGAIMVNGASAKLNISAGAIYDNKMTGSNADGVAVYNKGTFNFSGGYMSGNAATNSISYGGIIYNEGTLKMSGTALVGYLESVAGSKANETKGPAVTNRGTFEMTGGYITGNKNTSNAGGGVNQSAGSFKMTGGYISDNESVASSGGGIRLSGGSVILDGGNITGNKCKTYGGGIAIEGGEKTFTMKSGVIADNESGSYGGAIRPGAGTITKIEGGEIYGNTSTTGGGAIYMEGADAEITMTGGKIYDNVSNRVTYSVTTHSGTIFIGSGTSFTMQGGEIYGNEAAIGGAFQIVHDSETNPAGVLNIEAGYIYSNTARCLGGAVATSAGVVNVTGGSFGVDPNGEAAGNTANGIKVIEGEEGEEPTQEVAGEGGAFFLAGDCTVTIENATISNNTSALKGGAVSVKAGTVSITDVTVANNSSKRGGAMDLVDGEVEVSGATIEGNSATDYAGAIYTYSAKGVTLNDCIVTGNTSEGNSGAIHCDSGELTLNGCEIYENQAAGWGGGVRSYEGTITITGYTYVYDNTGNDGESTDNVCVRLGEENSVVILDDYFVGEIGATFEAGTVELEKALGSAIFAYGCGDGAVITSDQGYEVSEDEDWNIVLTSDKKIAIVDKFGVAVGTYTVFDYAGYKLPTALESDLGKLVGYICYDAEGNEKKTVGGKSVAFAPDQEDGNFMTVSATFMNIETEQGASVRLDGTNKTGLRVITKVNLSDLPEGTVVVPGAVIGTEVNAEGGLLKSDANGTTIQAIDMEDCQYLGSSYYAEMPAGFDKAFTVAVNMGESFYETPFYYVGYVTVTWGDYTTVVYADFAAETHTRSARQVAQAYADFLAENATWDFETECFEGMSKDQYQSLCALAAQEFDGESWVDVQ